MHKGRAVPRVGPSALMSEAIEEMTAKKLGMTSVVDEAGRLAGVITDGDLRRMIRKHGATLLSRTAGECMTTGPLTVTRTDLAAEALNVMEQNRITSLVVLAAGESGRDHPPPRPLADGDVLMGKRGRARRVRMILADVDGTLTDGSLTPYPDGEEIKSFNTKDGLGVLISRLAGLKVGFITGKNSKALKAGPRGSGSTSSARRSTRSRSFGRSWPSTAFVEEIAYIGDDLNDLAVLEAAGFSAAPADAVAAVRKRVDFVCRRRGGEGAFRELVDYILGAQRKWSLVKDRFREISDHKI